MAEVHLDHIGYDAPDVEQMAEQIAAAMAMPRARYVRETWASRMRIATLAERFAVTQTAAALRLAEASIVQGAAVVHPAFKLERGRRVDMARAIRMPVTDAPKRVAHFAA